jgi:DNA replication and repair protein RecF
VQIKHLSLQQFRNYETAEVALQPGVNLLVGPNGQGKTNLVEAIRYLSTLNSHRVAGYIPLIRQNESQAVIRCLVGVDDREIQLELELNRETANKAKINRSAAQKNRDILGYVNSVTFAPEDLDIVKRDPSARRGFIDELVIQVWPRFAGVFADYQRVLKQRNTLLKSARITKTTGSALSTLDAWDASLISYGSEIIAARVQLIEKISPLLTKAYQAIAIANNEPKLVIRSSVAGLVADDDDEELVATAGANTPEAGAGVITSADRTAIEAQFAAKLHEIRPKELERGITLVGPHRDDLLLMLGTLPAKGYASHGESWSYALALRLASIELLKADSRYGDPVLILDDVFAELDSGRRERLAQLIQVNEQVLITAAVAEDVPKTLTASVFNVRAGVITDGI